MRLTAPRKKEAS